MSASSAPGTPNEKRERILDAALSVCRRSGVAAARMDEVAAEAHVSKGTLYQFFDSKEDLFLATLLASYEEGLRIVDTRVDPDTDPGRQLADLLSGLVDVLATIAPRMHVHYQAWGVVANAPNLQDRLYGFLRRFHAEREEAAAELIRAGQRAGVFRADADAVAIAEGINTLLAGFLYRAAFDPERARPEALRACFDAMVMRALAPPREEGLGA